jgi:2-keto-4-pentenoate hydratase
MRDAIAAAGNLLTAWASGGQQLIAARERYPSWVTTIDDVYAVHGAMATHPLADALGGLAGYKQGSIGMVDGEPCVYGPLFRACFVEAPAGLSVHDANLFAMEAEFAFVLGADLAPTADGAPRSEAEVWDAVAEVALAIELVGTRHTLADATNFEKLADACCAAGARSAPTSSRRASRRCPQAACPSAPGSAAHARSARRSPRSRGAPTISTRAASV